MPPLRPAWPWPCHAAKKKVIIDKLQARLFDHLVPYVNYGQWFQPMAWRKGLTGVLVSPVPFFWNIKKSGS